MIDSQVDPSGVGTYSQHSATGATYGHQCVSDNSDSTYVYKNLLSAWYHDSYECDFSEIPPGAIINSIKVYGRVKQVRVDTRFKLGFCIGGTLYLGDQLDPDSSFGWFDQTWLQNPAASRSWTYSDLSDIEVAVSSYNYAQISELYMIVNYTPKKKGALMFIW